MERTAFICCASHLVTFCKAVSLLINQQASIPLPVRRNRVFVMRTE
jgi:hypothetical protein